jgi:Ni/Fe-hydrogenase 1 B-type cytochrome subunit
MGQYQEKYVWEVPVRAAHWVNMISVVLLSVTGLFIGSPHTLAASTSDYVMGWFRFVHFVAGYTLAVSVSARIYWAFATKNPYAGWREFLPILTPAGRERMFEAFRYYTFTGRKVPAAVGHNAMAATAYFFVYLLFICMIATGFALYSESAPNAFVQIAFGWILHAVPNQTVRLAHHLGMWLILGFVINHIYSTWLMDVKERGGVISGIFGGYKVVRTRHDA